MKSLKQLLIFPVCIAVLGSAALCAGCNGKIYEVYTNIPQGEFEITENNFKLGGEVGGYAAPDREEAVTADDSNYTAKGLLYPSVMFTDAQVVVQTDFNKDGEEERFSGFTKAVSQKLNAISKAVSSTVTGSDIYKFNNAAAGETIEITGTTYEILREALSVHEFTDGYYNPALYYNIKAYGFSTADRYPSTAAELPADEAIVKYTDLASHFKDIVLSDSGYFVTKPDYSVEVNGETLSLKLDLGGIAKGYAVDKIDGLFEEYGYEYGYFSFGSSSMLVKRHFLNGSFNIKFGNPRSMESDGYFKVSVSDEKLSTSGDNEQCYFIDGVRYCHIIDPTTGKPVRTGIMSVTVVGGSDKYAAARNDALTTAIMAMGKDKAISFIEEKLTDRKVVFTVE